MLASIPSFWLGLMLIDLFSVRLGWLPTGERDDFGDEVLELDISDLAAANRHPYSQSP